MAYRRLRRHAVIVNLKDGPSFKGILWRKAGALIVLKDVDMLAEGAHEPIRVDGDVVIERSNVAYFQVTG